MQPVLRVNLTTREIDSFEIPNEWVGRYLGGASLAARILYDLFSQSLDPLAPEAPLLFMTGPLTGTFGPAVGRYVICARSPQTGLWAESHCGGFWGPELRQTGYDGLLITGRTQNPSYLWIDEFGTEIRDASEFWGLDTYQTQEAVINELPSGGNIRVAAIGPAGEHLIPFASVLCDHGRAAGRTGMGALMGSKNLKAVAVRGNKTIPIAEAEKYKQLRSDINRTVKDDTQTRVLRDLGTAGVVEYYDYLGTIPKKYYQSGIFEGIDRISGATIADTILDGVSACHACVIACGRVVRLKDGKKRKGPEYETLIGFGSNLLVDDTAAITMMGELCDRYGMDTISLSNTIGFAISLFEKGIITKDDTDGLELGWGDYHVVEALIHKAAMKEGFGAQLAEGARSLGQRYGVEELAIQVNNLEVPYHDPRGFSGMALVYATSPRGACHNQSDYMIVDMGQADEELGMEFHDRQGGGEKAWNVARHQDWITVGNSLIMCEFANISPGSLVALTNAACNMEMDLDALLQIGERGWNLKRVINNRFGLTRENDRLPKPLLEALPDGGSAGFTIDLESMLHSYYQVRGWDEKTGYPSKGKLIELDLDWVIEDVWG